MDLKALLHYDVCKDTKLMHTGRGFRTSGKGTGHMDGGMLPNVQSPHYASTSELCCHQCNDNADCKVWEYDTLQKLCSLKTSAKGWGGARIKMVKVKNLISGWLEGYTPIALPGYTVTAKYFKSHNVVWSSVKGIPGHRHNYRPSFETCAMMCTLIGDDCGCMTYSKFRCTLTKDCVVAKYSGEGMYNHPPDGVWQRTGKHPLQPINGTLDATGVTLGAGGPGKGAGRMEDCGPDNNHCGKMEFYV